MHLRFFAVAVLFSGYALSASAATTYQVSESGQFGSSTPTTAYSTAGGTFSYSFDLQSNPTITAYSSSNDFVPVVSNFSYTLNGVTTTTAGSVVTFYNSNDSGLFNVCPSAACSAYFVIEGEQAYSGSESSPTILPGSYVPNFADFDGVSLASTSDVLISGVAVTPEPSSFVLLGTGLLGLAGVMKRRLNP